MPHPQRQKSGSVVRRLDPRLRRRAPELRPDDGVVEAYEEAIESVATLNQEIETVRWAILKHNADEESPQQAKVFSNRRLPRGVVRLPITGVDPTRAAFKNDCKVLDGEVKEALKKALEYLMIDPQPKKLRLEKLSGIKNPGIYAIHINSNHSHKLRFNFN